MTLKNPKKRTIALSPGAIFLSVSLAALLVAAVWFTSYRYFLGQEFRRAEARTSLYHSTVLAELERFEHLTRVVAVDPYVSEALAGESAEPLNARLSEFAEAAGLDAIYVMRPDGMTIASSNAGLLGSFVGQNYGFRPYFQEARAGGTGTFYGIGATTGLPGYFIADPVRNTDGAVIGVVALKIDLVPFEDTWRAAGGQVFLSDQFDVVLLASDANWRYRVLDPLTETERAQIDETRQFPGQALEALNWQADPARSWARIDGAPRLHIVRADLPHAWRLHYLSEADRPISQAWLTAGGFVAVCALALLALQVQRGQRLGSALRRSEEEEAQLRRTNAALAREIDERKRAERRLEETRGELERASRLAALGQLSASVSHELSQPIAAMRNRLTAYELKHATSDLTQAINGLIDRMEAITRQLKFFARSKEEAFEDLDLRGSVDAVLDLMVPSFEAIAVDVDHVRPSDAVMVRGARLRLEQVLTNIMRNAVDAMEEVDDPHLWIGYGASGDNVWIEVADAGHGLGDATMSELREPFVTTRASGQGMGLGLAISSSIMEDHGGWLEARNRSDGAGAIFRMNLPTRPRAEMAAE